MRPVLALILAIVATAAPLAGASASAPFVVVEQGKLLGARSGAVVSFLGIPYASAPVGPDRWRPPQPPPRWSEARSAVEFGASCLQTRWAPSPPYSEEFVQRGRTGEDCLFLNVWKPQSTAIHLPVLVFIHGGGFTGGSGSMPIYNGAVLASRGAVIVTINYRLGIFGYLAHPALTAEDARHTSGDYGLLDQIAALKWVKRNIVKFDGDPDNITVAGESGGAISVNSLILSPDAEGLFDKAIAFSGSGMGFQAPNLEQAERQGLEIAKSLGAITAPDLRALSPQALLAAETAAAAGPAGKLKFAFWPVVDNHILPADPESRVGAPRSPVPLMTGFNSDENSFVEVKTASDLNRYASAWFGPSAAKILALYPHASNPQARESAALLARDRYMTSLLLWTDARTRSSGETIYRYLYSHPSSVERGRSYGAFHTAEMPYVFGNLSHSSRPYGAKDRAVAKELQARLLAFMRYGHPDGPGQPSWPKAVPNDGVVMALDAKRGMSPAVSTPARRDALIAFAQAGGRLVVF